MVAEGDLKSHSGQHLGLETSVLVYSSPVIFSHPFPLHVNHTGIIIFELLLVLLLQLTL